MFKKKTKKLINGRRGFSMVETLTVVAMSLVLGTLAVPKIVETVQHGRLNSTMRNLSATIQAARFVAILRQGVYGVKIDNTNNTFEVVQWNGSAWQSMTTTGAGGSTAYDSFASRKQFNSNVTISATGLGTANVIAFNAKGELMNSSVTTPTVYSSGNTVPVITVTTPAGSRDITLTRFGNIKNVVHATTNQL